MKITKNFEETDVEYKITQKLISGLPGLRWPKIGFNYNKSEITGFPNWIFARKQVRREEVLDFCSKDVNCLQFFISSEISTDWVFIEFYRMKADCSLND